MAIADRPQALNLVCVCRSFLGSKQSPKISQDFHTNHVQKLWHTFMTYLYNIEQTKSKRPWFANISHDHRYQSLKNKAHYLGGATVTPESAAAPQKFPSSFTKKMKVIQENA